MKYSQTWFKLALAVSYCAFFLPAVLSFYILFSSGMWRIEAFSLPKVPETFGFFVTGIFPLRPGAPYFSTAGVALVWPFIVGIFIRCVGSQRLLRFIRSELNRRNLQIGAIFYFVFILLRVGYRLVESRLGISSESSIFVVQLALHLVCSAPIVSIFGLIYAKQNRILLAETPVFYARLCANFILHGFLGCTWMWGLFFFVWWVWMAPLEAVEFGLNRGGIDQYGENLDLLLPTLSGLTAVAGFCSLVISALIIFVVPSMVLGLAYWRTVAEYSEQRRSKPTIQLTIQA